MPTKMRYFAVPDHIWQAAKVEAVRRHETVSAATVRFLAAYGRGEDHLEDRPPPTKIDSDEARI